MAEVRPPICPYCRTPASPPHEIGHLCCSRPTPPGGTPSTAASWDYRDAAEAYLRGAGPPPLIHWLPSEREVATDCAIQAWYPSSIKREGTHRNLSDPATALVAGLPHLAVNRSCAAIWRNGAKKLPSIFSRWRTSA